MRDRLSPKSIAYEMDPALLEEVKAVLTKQFEAPSQIKSVTLLSEPKRRNLVLRIVLAPPLNGAPQSLILKQSIHEHSSEEDQEAFARFARDWAGLEFLSHSKEKTSIAPQFYGGSTHHRFILLEDLGENHRSLVDSLTGQEQDTALSSLKRFMRCLGKFHTQGHGEGIKKYQDILQALNPEAEVWHNDLQKTLDDMLPKISAILKKLSIPYTSDMQDEVTHVIQAVFAPGPFTTFVHGDICPDNVFDDPQKNTMHLIDFEWGFVRSALLDGTYLRMSMPTCWCSKALPEEFIGPLENIYRQELMKKMPAAKEDPLYYKAYTEACAFWMLNVLGEIEKVIDADRLYYSGPVPENALWNPGENRGRPRVLARLSSFIQVSLKHKMLPHLRTLAEQVLKEVKILWPDAKPLELFPAFRTNK